MHLRTRADSLHNRLMPVGPPRLVQPVRRNSGGVRDKRRPGLRISGIGERNRAGRCVKTEGWPGIVIGHNIILDPVGMFFSVPTGVRLCWGAQWSDGELPVRTADWGTALVSWAGFGRFPLRCRLVAIYRALASGAACAAHRGTLNVFQTWTTSEIPRTALAAIHHRTGLPSFFA